ncbi:MAG TPA: hypothetical protein VIT38_12010 [Allosphingosinicella sp.]
MNKITTIGPRCGDVQMDAIRAEFGAVIAERILEAEAADFLWNARVQERYLGQHFDLICGEEDASQDISRIAFLSLFDGAWYAGIGLVDGDGVAVDLLWKLRFESLFEAELAFDRVR